MKHIVDKDRGSADTKRVTQYVAQERRAGQHPNTQALHRRARPTTEAHVQEYLRIDRGIEA